MLDGTFCSCSFVTSGQLTRSGNEASRRDRARPRRVTVVTREEVPKPGEILTKAVDRDHAWCWNMVVAVERGPGPSPFVGGDWQVANE